MVIFGGVVGGFFDNYVFVSLLDIVDKRLVVFLCLKGSLFDEILRLSE